MRKNLLFILTLLLLVPFFACSKSEVKTPERMDWWREARFGLFIHWGLYAIPAGEWGE